MPWIETNDCKTLLAELDAHDALVKYYELPLLSRLFQGLRGYLFRVLTFLRLK